ncbi:MAG: addiction module antidote protein, HigA family [Desulfobacteraceae bacterium IS3]|nr:MAG: addiction module antidote protein, HigA family [Desulfobacteraceae bacterium IS3]
MVRIPTHRTPIHPGEMLLEEFLIPAGLTQKSLAKAILMPYRQINEIVKGRRGITPGTALRLAKFFNISADFWMNLQLRWDLYHAHKSEMNTLKTIQPFDTENPNRLKHHLPHRV